jgi:hypothetical protein
LVEPIFVKIEPDFRQHGNFIHSRTAKNHKLPTPFAEVFLEFLLQRRKTYPGAGIVSDISVQARFCHCFRQFQRFCKICTFGKTGTGAMSEPFMPVKARLCSGHYLCEPSGSVLRKIEGWQFTPLLYFVRLFDVLVDAAKTIRMLSVGADARPQAVQDKILGVVAVLALRPALGYVSFDFAESWLLSQR